MRHGTLRQASVSFGLKRSVPISPIHRHRYSSSQTVNNVIFSGIQPTGIPHIGNYLGALRQWVQTQTKAEPSTAVIFSIVDLHAITVQQDAIQLRQQKRETLASLLAIGLDPERVTIFHQSAVSGTTHVPVGHDQLQHLEFVRESARNFNARYGDFFPEPEAITSSGKRIMSLKDPSLKMSKSHKAARSRILLNDSPEEIKLKVKAALTDSFEGISYDPIARPGISNLLEMMASVDVHGRSVEQIASDCKTLGKLSFKQQVAEVLSGALADVREKFEYLLRLDDGNYIDHVAAQGAKQAEQIAGRTIKEVKSMIGLE
ncbi:MAG: hypothetical protein Q9167_004034 [Letrouitia subvulpina]